MNPTNKPKVTVLVSHLIYERPALGMPNQYTLEQIKKYISPKPLRRPTPRPKKQ